METQSPVCMIFGQQWVPLEYYKLHYATLVEDAFNHKPTRLVVGAANGIDTYAQRHLAQLCEESDDSDNDFNRISVYDKENKDGRIDKRFLLNLGYNSYPERDFAMFSVSTYRIGILAQFDKSW